MPQKSAALSSATWNGVLIASSLKNRPVSKNNQPKVETGSLQSHQGIRIQILTGLIDASYVW